MNKSFDQATSAIKIALSALYRARFVNGIEKIVDQNGNQEYLRYLLDMIADTGIKTIPGGGELINSQDVRKMLEIIPIASLIEPMEDPHVQRRVDAIIHKYQPEIIEWFNDTPHSIPLALRELLVTSICS